MLALLCACAALACSSKEPEPELGGDTHWLQACDDDGQCGRGSCSCGLCTEPCKRDEECAGGPAAQCYATASPGVRAACSAGTAPDTSAAGICLAQCSEDGECADGQQCIGGACVQERERSDAGVPLPPDASVLASGLPSVRPSEFAQLMPDISFEGPGPTGEPERNFVGSAEGLLGTWSESSCDPADNETWSYGPGGCVTLVIARSGPNGEIRGELRLRNEFDQRPWAINWQQFAPATDPDVGYPVELKPEEYAQVSQSPAFGPYSMLDPYFDGTRLQFWLAPMELWDGWCKLQTSYRVPDGDPPYQCVPAGALAGDPAVDLGKLVLCTSEWSGGACLLQQCDAADPSCTNSVATVGCSCLNDAGDYEIDRPECSPANCSCDAAGCRANWPEHRVDVEITVAGDEMTVREGFNPKRPGAAMAVLRKELTP